MVVLDAERLLYRDQATGKVLDADGRALATTLLADQLGYKAPIISGQGATRTLLAAETGSTCLFDRAAGIVYTLPAPVVGLFFDFVTTVTITSGAAEVDTDAGTTFILGEIVNLKTDLTTLFAIANGTSIVKISSNGSTTGGLKGGKYRLTCISATVWLIEGNVQGSGAIATPFA